MPTEAFGLREHIIKLFRSTEQNLHLIHAMLPWLEFGVMSIVDMEKVFAGYNGDGTERIAIGVFQVDIDEFPGFMFVSRLVFEFRLVKGIGDLELDLFGLCEGGAEMVGVAGFVNGFLMPAYCPLWAFFHDSARIARFHIFIWLRKSVAI